MSSCRAFVLKVSVIDYAWATLVVLINLPNDKRGGVLDFDNVFDVGDPEEAVEHQAHARERDRRGAGDGDRGVDRRRVPAVPGSGRNHVAGRKMSPAALVRDSAKLFK